MTEPTVRFAAIGLNHNHIYGQTRAMLNAGCELAACYAAATLTLGSFLLVVCAFLCGMAWGGLRVATRSLVAPIVAHVVWDLGIFLAWPLV